VVPAAWLAPPVASLEFPFPFVADEQATSQSQTTANADARTVILK
jgi:hypothetical protein